MEPATVLTVNINCVTYPHILYVPSLCLNVHLIVFYYYPFPIVSFIFLTNIIEKWVKVEPEGGLGKELIGNLLKLVKELKPGREQL